MISFSRFFTPPLTPIERTQVFRALGLHRLHFHYTEKTEIQLRHFELADGFFQPRLSTVSGETASVTVTSRQPRTPLEPLARPLSLWEELFPYPFSRLENLRKPNSDWNLSVTPPEFRAELCDLWDSLSEFEAAVSQTELSLLFIQDSEFSIPLLLHFVRRRRIRIGTSHKIAALAAARLNGVAEELERAFGTHVPFYVISPPSPPLAVVPALAETFRKFARESRSNPIPSSSFLQEIEL